MARVQTDERFRRLVQFRWIRTVAHNAVMLGRAARVVAGPPDNRKIGISPFDLWPLHDPDARGFICRRTHLRARWGWVESATDPNHPRQFHKQFVHGWDL